MTGYLGPTDEQLKSFRLLPQDRPVEMLNLVRFRQYAAYEDGHPFAPKNLTGREAYYVYLAASEAIVRRYGGDVIWTAAPDTIFIGPEGDAWDLAFIVHYKVAKRFLDMIVDEDYRGAATHRQAALADSRLIRCTPIARQKD